MSAPSASGGDGAFKAGIAYSGIVFAAGFVFGTVRTLLLVPRIGPLGAVLVELPLMLAIAWLVCRWLVPRFGVAAGRSARLRMGAVALVLLILLELILFVAAFGGTVAGFVTNFFSPAGAAGLAGQIAFAAMPLLIRR